VGHSDLEQRGSRVVIGGELGPRVEDSLKDLEERAEVLLPVTEAIGELAEHLAGGRVADTAVVLANPELGITPRAARHVRLFTELGFNEVLSVTALDDPGLHELLARAREQASRPSARSRQASVPADRFRVKIVWSAEEPLLPGRSYTLQIGERTAGATIAPLRYRLDLDSGEHIAATTLGENELGVGDIELTEPISPMRSGALRFAPFVLRDPLDDKRLGVGLIEYALRRSQNVCWQPLTVDKVARADKLGQRPTVLWFTGLSGAGKSTIANLVEAELHSRGHHTYLLDGDNVRHGLNSDLGFTAADRVENIRRVAEVARLMVDAGLIVMVSFISPFRAERAMARSLVGPEEFLEVWVDTPLEVAEQRDPKGLYGKARRGELANFTGIDSPYEPPEHPDVHVETTRTTPHQAAAQVVAALERARRLNSARSA